MDEPENSALLGRVSRLRRLEGALRLAKAAHDSAQYRKDAPDSRNLFAAHQSVLAIIEFIDSSPDWEKDGLSFAFHKLQLALLNIVEGRRETWLLPSKRRGSPPKLVQIRALRGRYAAVMDFLIKVDQWPEKCAGEFVTRHAGKGIMESLVGRATKKTPTWQAVQDWRQSVIGRADPSYERNSYYQMWRLIENRGFGKSPSVMETEAKALLKGLRNALINITD